METENHETAASVRDALLKEGSPEKLKETITDKINVPDAALDIAEKSAAESNSNVESSTVVEEASSKPKEAEVLAEKDDLLEKLEEAVKDKPTLSQKSEDEIKKTSADDFLKKIENVVASGGGEKSDAVSTTETNDNAVAAADGDDDADAVEEVKVGNLVLKINDDNEKKENDESAVSSSNVDDESNKEDEEVHVKESEAVVVASAEPAEACEIPESSSVVVVDDDVVVTKTSSAEAMSVDESESSSNEGCMEVDADEKNDVMIVEEEAPVASVTTDVELKEASPTEVIDDDDDDDCEIVELSPEVEDVEIKEPIPENVSEDVEMVNEKPVVAIDENVSSEAVATSADAEIGEEKIEADVPTSSTADVPTPVVVNKALSNIKSIETTPCSKSITPVSTPNVVFNSTPIEKQFEISSENVSKISEAAETSHTTTDKDDDTGKSASKTEEENTTESRIGTTSETDHPSSDGINKYIEVVKKFNGLADTTTDEEDSSANVKINQSTSTIDITTGNSVSSAVDNQYEVQICCEGTNLQFLSVERVGTKKLNETSASDKTTSVESSIQSSSSNGSVNSLPAFSLPAANITEVSTSTSTASQTIASQMLKTKHTLNGIDKLCDFIINEFTKIKKSLNVEDASVTPKQSKRNQKQTSAIKEAQTPSSTRGKRGTKRSLIEEEVETTPKTAKQARKEILQTPKKDAETTPAPQPSTPVAEEVKGGPSVLAKWVDKKYYAGKVTAERAGNKFVVLFEDGASKVLTKDSIVFGEDDILPLQDQEVHALINEDDYEIGTVLSIEKTDTKVIYTVKTDSTTIKVTASEIYLEDDQAKAIQKIQNIKAGGDGETGAAARSSRNKRTAASPGTPEAGFSGGIGKRGNKRQKRLPFNTPVNGGLSESDASDTQDSVTPPQTPETGLEMVEGVQPEMQKCPKESELSRMIYISDYRKYQPECNVDDLLGPIPTSRTLFRNKHFLLTCTVGLKPHRYETNSNNFDNKFRQFSKVPYVKCLLQKQLEASGAKVYQYFEDVPKNKYKQCKLIAPRPCLTAKYVQCLAADIQAISHEWVVDSCKDSKLADMKKYHLPAGWSILSNQFIEWKTGKSTDGRLNSQPFAKSSILVAGEQNDFNEFWGRVCKLAGSKVRFVKSMADVTPTTTGFMVTESDFSPTIKSKANHFGISIVSTVWIVQSLIAGFMYPPSSHPKLSQVYQDDDI